LHKNSQVEEFFFCNQAPVNIKPNEAVFKEFFIPLSFGRRMQIEELKDYRITYELEISGPNSGVIIDYVDIGVAKVESFLFSPVSRKVDFSKSIGKLSETFFLFPGEDEVKYDSSTCLRTNNG